MDFSMIEGLTDEELNELYNDSLNYFVADRWYLCRCRLRGHYKSAGVCGHTPHGINEFYFYVSCPDVGMRGNRDTGDYKYGTCGNVCSAGGMECYGYYLCYCGEAPCSR